MHQAINPLPPQRLRRYNKVLASAHVPGLNIGKVSLSAIANMGWVPLFISSAARARVRLAQKTKTRPTDRRGRACVCVCDHCTEPPYSSVSVCGPHHTVAIIKISCCTSRHPESNAPYGPCLHWAARRTGANQAASQDMAHACAYVLNHKHQTRHESTHTSHSNSDWV